MVRLYLYFPIGHPAEEAAFTAFINQLLTGVIDLPAPLNVSGFTHSARNAPSQGYYRLSSQHEWDDDPIVHLFIDLDTSETERVFEEGARRLKRIVGGLYKEEGREQDEIWCVSHALQRW